VSALTHAGNTSQDLVQRTSSLLRGPHVDADASAHLFAALGEVPLRVVDGALPAGQAVEATRLALGLQGDLRDHVRLTQSTAFARVQDAMAALSRGATPTELLEGAATALCQSCGFDRALISRVEGSSWVPRVVHAGDGPDLTELLTDLHIPLKAGLVETEVVRRRTPALVEDAQSDPRTFRPMVEQGEIGSYVVAPIVVADKVVGLFHADLLRRSVTGGSRDLVQLFADCFGRAYEAAVLAERVAHQREHLRRAFFLADAEGELVDPTVVSFSRRPGLAATGPIAMAQESDNGLTAREQEILVLVSTGATNLQIAERLVLADSTVKSHVKRILRKLHAANRAEAASLYLRGTVRTG
jgi:DNA-binding CsgD family transcriptional regulator